MNNEEIKAVFLEALDKDDKKLEEKIKLGTATTREVERYLCNDKLCNKLSKTL